MATVSDPGVLTGAFEALEDDAIRLTLARRIFELSPGLI